ncbi:MAG: glycosyltransferase 87 family protein [Candidatus Cloacimonetes bacterium]|nr:glycosyltransferase 87 family protein [Candidatus Cloacimonadota bacterium]
MKKKDLLVFLLIMASFFAILSFFSDVRNTFNYAGVDLRNRVVGSRLILQKLDPYFTKWKEGDSVRLLDPRDNPDWEVNRVTVTPTMLQLFIPLSLLNYSIIRMIWLFLQWLMLLLTIFLFTKITKYKQARMLIWICGLFFIGTSYFWRLHVERGQIYIFYVLIFSLFFYFLAKKKQLSSGISLGFLIALRPTFILVLIPLLIKKKWKLTFFSITALLLIVLLTVTFTNWEVWNSYFRAMNIHAQIHLDTVQSPSTYYPYINIEGVGNLFSLANIPINDTSIQYLFRSIGITLNSNNMKIIFFIFIFVTSSLIYKFRTKIDEYKMIIIASLLVILSEFFIPAARYSYNNVTFLIPMSLIILDFDKYQRK